MSNRVIWKYQIPLTATAGLTSEDTFTLQMPPGAIPISVGVQNGAPVLWAIVPKGESYHPRTFYLATTGNPTKRELDYDEYIGTILLHDDQLVLHVFEAAEIESWN